jgi:uncharacterized membrane protein
MAEKTSSPAGDDPRSTVKERITDESQPPAELVPVRRSEPAWWFLKSLEGAAPTWAVIASGVAGVLAAVLIPGTPRFGVNLVICALAVAVPVGLLAYQRGRATARRPPVDPGAIALGAISIGLAAVAAVRASEWLVAGCALAAGCLGATAALDLRRWKSVLLTVPLFGVVVLRALPWAGRALPVGKARVPSQPWVTGIVVGGLSTFVVAGLLASADAAFADLLDALWPAVDTGLVPARGFVFLVVTAIALGGMFAVSTRVEVPRPAVGEARHPAEWLIPLVLVAVTIAAFLAVEATTLFGGAEVVTAGSSLSHAGRAREGFGQLTVVTLIVLALLAWAGRAMTTGPTPYRRLLGLVGGTLLVLALLLAGSALRRLWLYQDQYGWTVSRLNAGAFEFWVAFVLLGVGVGWLVRRTDLLPRFVVGSAGLGLLVIAMTGPDAMVATANVDRYEQTLAGSSGVGQIDIYYVSALSADAVPALDRLPEPMRSCVLAGRSVDDDPWYGWNRARSRADALLRADPPVACTG